MIIDKILDISFEDSETFYIKAVAEDCVLVHNQTLYDPSEYGPATVDAFISLTEVQDYVSEMGLKIPTEHPIDAVKEYLEAINYDLDWRIITNDEY